MCRSEGNARKSSNVLSFSLKMWLTHLCLRFEQGGSQIKWERHMATDTVHQLATKDFFFQDFLNRVHMETQ